jgi:hypothetical protein
MLPSADWGSHGRTGADLAGLSLQPSTADDDRNTLVHRKNFTMRAPGGQVGRVGRVLQAVA